MSRTRKRSLDGKTIRFANLKNWSDPSVDVPQPSQVIGTGSQSTEDELHSYLRSQRRWSGGGPFYSTRTSYSIGVVNLTDLWGSNNRRYSGIGFLPPPSASHIASAFGDTISPKSAEEIDADLVGIGPSAIARANPRSPQASLGTALVELKRDGLPSFHGVNLWRSKAERFKSLGDEYLNHQFGWAPLVRDIQASAKIASGSADSTIEYQTGTGRNFHRTLGLGTDSFSAEASPKTEWVRCPADNFFRGFSTGATMTLVKTTTRSRWFVGLFTQPPVPDYKVLDKHWEFGRKAKEVLGLELNPELLWEASPWSWAVDWVSNFGDVFSNVSNLINAGQVLRYAYLMEHSSTEYKAILKGHTGLSCKRQGNKVPHPLNGPLSSSLIIETKRRHAASPFGFGVDWEGLNPFQLSICAALGISR